MCDVLETFINKESGEPGAVSPEFFTRYRVTHENTRGLTAPGSPEIMM